jgi:hypothetical protein
MTAAAPFAWHYDRVFRWSAVGAGVAFAIFVLRFIDTPALRAQSSVPGSPVPANLGPTYGVQGAPPAPERERFGTVLPANHQ